MARNQDCLSYFWLCKQMLSESMFKHRVSNKDFWKRTSEPSHVMLQGSATCVTPYSLYGSSQRLQLWPKPCIGGIENQVPDNLPKNMTGWNEETWRDTRRGNKKSTETKNIIPTNQQDANNTANNLELPCYALENIICCSTTRTCTHKQVGLKMWV